MKCCFFPPHRSHRKLPHYMQNFIVMWKKDTRLYFHWKLIIPPHTTNLLGGYIGFTPSIPPASRVCSVAPSVLVGSISYLYILSSNLCVLRVKLLAKFWNLNFWQFFKICKFDFVLFWLGIWCESVVWVIMWQWGVSQNAGVLVYT